ncbi:hypothetical protein MCAG_05038 [Micromonospora sp. ATCC 39149]|uniref:FUSC family protein n=1 Tax=Micromonospora sp. (strain ATCC 39149 / NRRL 15099 / SCC 1413) TaxID=219305 RepID=UPI0001A506B9|nr:FUSC family protein [Micromonospora sp. ATCC 39149]EEP74711.1 hypothetical protein MCAG_05038 [Micromonospora sp. ATCC 39149]
MASDLAGGLLAGWLRTWLAGTGRDSVRRLRTYLIIGVQAGLAAAIAWLIAHEVLGTEEPTFAPAAAVAVIATSLGNRARRTIELLVGVGLGIAAGDLLIAVLGTGPWQTGLIVFLAVTGAAAIRGAGLLMTQAGATAVLVATLTPGNSRPGAAAHGQRPGRRRGRTPRDAGPRTVEPAAHRTPGRRHRLGPVCPPDHHLRQVSHRS